MYIYLYQDSAFVARNLCDKKKREFSLYMWRMFNEKLKKKIKSLFDCIL
jgi:hypothetical protein